MMAGAASLLDFSAAGMQWGSGDHRLRLGHAKIMLTLTTGELHPSLQELAALVSRCHRTGFPAAVHAVESEAVTAAATVLGNDRSWPRWDGQSRPGACLIDRIEHCSEAPTAAVDLVRASGASVVTQPGFVYWNGDGYLDRVSPELLPHLYPIETLRRAGIPVAFSSDAPVIGPDPWPGICAAVTGYTRRRNRFWRTGPDRPTNEASVLEALRSYTIGGALAEGTQRVKGSIEPGKLADLVLLDADPTRVDPSALDNIRTVLTVVGGRVAWEQGR
jgi:predicted amidohydrolase YtcJ